MPELDPDYLRAVLCANSFPAFVRQFWHSATGYPLRWGYHLDALCEFLTAVKLGQIENLLVCLPPRCSKSVTCSVLFPAWLWASDDPAHKFISGSHGLRLSTQAASDHRRLMSSDLWRRTFPDLTIADGAEALSQFRNNQGGERLSVSVGSGVTGFNASVIIADDVIEISKRTSEAEREAAVNWVLNDLFSRAIPGRRVPKLVVGQRVHSKDLAGELIDRFRDDPSWSFLVLPLEYDPRATLLPNAIGWTDKRTEPGQSLWPEAFPPATISQLKRERRDTYHVLYNQNPLAEAGNAFRREWLRYYGEDAETYTLGEKKYRKADAVRIATTDLASSTSSTADYTVCQVWDLVDGNLVLVHQLRERLDGTRLVPTLTAQYQTYRPVYVAVEQVGMQKALCDQIAEALRREFVPVVRYRPQGDKETRSIPAQAMAEAGRVWLPRGKDWVSDFEAELLGFPLAPKDDQCDCLSMCAALAQQRHRGRTEEAKPPEEARAEWDRRQKDYRANLWRVGLRV